MSKKQVGIFTHKPATHTQTQAGGQHRVVTPEEKIRMTKESDTGFGKHRRGGQRDGDAK